MFESHHFKDHQREARIFKFRLGVMVAVMAILFCVLIYRYYSLQVINYLEYATQSEHNRVHVEPIPPTRGIIYDRNGEVLADNRASFTLSLVVNKTMDLDATLSVLRTLVEITPADLEKFYKLKKQQIHPLEPIPLRYRLTEDEIARLAVNEYRLEGVQVDAELVRYYPYGDAFAHTIGYVSRISESDLEKFTEEQVRLYSGTHSIGKSGIEASYESELLGQVGSKNVETNARGREIRVLDRIDPTPGKNVTLNLDLKMQQQAETTLKGRRGSVVAIEVKTGAVVTAVSNPGFDPNLFVTGISFADYKALNESPETPLINRFIQGQFPSGSTIKPLMGLMGLHLGFTDVNRTISDPGYFTLAGSSHRYRDWTLASLGGGHGSVNLKKAISESCDTYFYELAWRMGVDNIHPFGNRFGLGIRTGIDIPNERIGVWPSRAWKRAKTKQPWYPGDNVSIGIGQGYVSVTPLQLGVMVATMASRGDRYRPRLVKAIDGVETKPILEDHIEIKKEYWDAVFEGMEDAVYGGGLATFRQYHLGMGADYRIAAKSGTAQVVNIAQDAKYTKGALKVNQRDHVLFVGFAPADDPKLAIAIILENDDHLKSSENPSLLARRLFDGYLRGIFVGDGPVHGFPEDKTAVAPVAPVPTETYEAPDETDDDQKPAAPSADTEPKPE
ncbi:penicillin-binding protein 2 [Cellvibrio sp.]|uniref:penicillin-binding protein 2 n=1 Tax=Cellvibrio sp. TaxID=1965322 RepID=UPI0039648CA8